MKNKTGRPTNAPRLDSPREGRTLSTAERVLQLLDLVAQEPGRLTPKQIAARLGVSLSTAYYLIHTLQKLDFVEEGGRDPGLRLGPKIAGLYHRYVADNPLVDHLEPLLQELGERTEARAYLAVWNGRDIEIVDIRGRRGLRELPSISTGFRGAAHALALGKIFLVHLPFEEWPPYLQQPEFTRFTLRTTADPRLLAQQLAIVREQGIAFDIEEYTDGMSCVAAPVYDGAGQLVASVGISLPTRRLQIEQATVVELVRFTSRQASDECSCRG